MSAAPNALERASAELVRRRKARDSLVEYARYIDIPGAPSTDEADDILSEQVLAPVESDLVRHHVVILEALQRCMERPNGRLMILAPPGSAKSTYASVVGPTWALGKWPGYRIILASYTTKLARKHSRRGTQVVRSRRWRSLWRERPELDRRLGPTGQEEWELTNGSSFMAAGILAGITGNRAHGAICDDLIAGRQEAESPTIRSNTMEAFRDDVESRLLPGGWICLINTRWHQEDPSGAILPDDYDGRSGDIVCKDGRVWHVLNIPARCEHADDPVGRELGEYLWPEWFPKSHWQAFENDPTGQRRWASLYQGRPTGDSGDDFDKADALWYDDHELPARLTFYIASDLAVTDPEDDLKAAGRVDWSEHGVFGMDDIGHLWAVDWWSGQKETDVAIDAALDFVPMYNPVRWWNEGGVIEAAIAPAVRRRMQERSEEKDGRGRKHSHYVHREALPKIADKRAKCQAFAARYGARTTHWPRSKPWAHQVLAQLTGFPGHRHDDKYDVCGLIGRGIDKMLEAPQPPEKRDYGPKPFTGKWLEHTDKPRGPRYR